MSNPNPHLSGLFIPYGDTLSLQDIGDATSESLLNLDASEHTSEVIIDLADEIRNVCIDNKYIFFLALLQLVKDEKLLGSCRYFKSLCPVSFVKQGTKCRRICKYDVSVEQTSKGILLYYRKFFEEMPVLQK